MTPEAQLSADIARILSKAALPQERIAGFHSFTLAEDGCTHLLMLDLVGGRTLVVVASPGEPLRLSIHC